MRVKVNCPVAGCGTQVDVKYLPKHLENVHKLDGEVVLRLHPTATYQHTPADDQEPEEEAEAKAEAERQEAEQQQSEA